MQVSHGRHCLYIHNLIYLSISPNNDTIVLIYNNPNPIPTACRSTLSSRTSNLQRIILYVDIIDVAYISTALNPP